MTRTTRRTLRIRPVLLTLCVMNLPLMCTDFVPPTPSEPSNEAWPEGIEDLQTEKIVLTEARPTTTHLQFGNR